MAELAQELVDRYGRNGDVQIKASPLQQTVDASAAAGEAAIGMSGTPLSLLVDFRVRQINAQAVREYTSGRNLDGQLVD